MIGFHARLFRQLNERRAAEAQAYAEACAEEQMNMLKVRQKEIVMARLMTREERIMFEMAENYRLNKSSLEQSRGYCESLVDGEIAIEKKVKQMQTSMTRKEAVQKVYELNTSLKSDEIIKVLEILGLLKFKEPEPVNVNRERFKAAMRKYGYAEGGCGFHDALEAYDSIYT